MGSQNREVVLLKKRLWKLRDTGFELENQLARLEWAEHNLIGVGSPLMSDMPKNPSPSNDRLSNAMNKKLEIEAEIDRISGDYFSERRLLSEAVEQLALSSERTVIRMRYFDRADWSDVVKVVYSKRKDYEDNIDNYYKRIFRIHGDALVEMAQIIKNFSQNCGVNESK